ERFLFWRRFILVRNILRDDSRNFVFFLFGCLTLFLIILRSLSCRFFYLRRFVLLFLVSLVIRRLIFFLAFFLVCSILCFFFSCCFCCFQSCSSFSFSHFFFCHNFDNFWWLIIR